MREIDEAIIRTNPKQCNPKSNEKQRLFFHDAGHSEVV